MRPLLTLTLLLTTVTLAAQETTPAPAPQEEKAVSGRELYAACTQPQQKDGEGERFCMTFIAGLVQTVTTMQTANGGADKAFCIDMNKVSPEEVRDKAVSWLGQNTARLDEEAYVLVMEALNRAYPCGTTNI